MDQEKFKKQIIEDLIDSKIEEENKQELYNFKLGKFKERLKDKIKGEAA